MLLSEPLQKQINVEPIIHQYGITIKMMGFSIRTQRFQLKTHYISKEAPDKQGYILLRLNNQIYVLGRANIKPFGTQLMERMPYTGMYNNGEVTLPGTLDRCPCLQCTLYFPIIIFTLPKHS